MHLIRCLRRELMGQVRQSRNLHENAATKAWRLMLAMVYLAKVLRCGVNAMRREQIGSVVVMDGERRVISNWSNSEFPTIAGNGFYRQLVPRSEFRLVGGPQEWWHRFSFGATFYLGSWYDIDVQQRLYPAVPAVFARKAE